MNFSARFVALVAGVFFFFLAVVTQGVLPFVEPSARTNVVTAVVRTDLGQLKWMLTEATDYTPQQQLGRRVYLREGCWYCHSQYVRPVTGETRRWGPVSEAGEYTYDVPHLFGTRRIGPDLTRVGVVETVAPQVGFARQQQRTSLPGRLIAGNRQARVGVAPPAAGAEAFAGDEALAAAVRAASAEGGREWPGPRPC